MDRPESSTISDTRPKRKNSVHYPADVHLTQIVPPAPRSGATDSDILPAGSSGHKDAHQYIDILQTPGTFNEEHIDFSPILGYGSGKYTESSLGDELGTGAGGAGKSRKKKRAPEQKITIFALRLALIEKAASGIGTIAFLWATVVILGGFASTVSLTEFWVVTVIILAESSRIFSRSHELEWHHLTSKSPVGLGHRILDAARSISSSDSFSSTVYHKLKMRILGHEERSSPKARQPVAAEIGVSDARTSSSNTSTSAHRRKGLAGISPKPLQQIATQASEPQKRTWSKLTLPLIPYTRQIVTTKVVSKALYFVQIISAVVSIALSLWRLTQQNFYDRVRLGDQPNLIVSLNVFYGLSILEAGLFLLERCYWEYRVRHKMLLERVRVEAELTLANAHMIEQFFYDVYAECLKGSVFDGLDMDLVSYSLSWLKSEEFNEQLGGARLLNEIVSVPGYDKPRLKDWSAEDALRRLGTTQGILERLVEMLSWNSRHESDLLLEIATIICRLVVYNRNCSRLVAVPGSVEALVSLLVPQKCDPEDHVSVEQSLTIRLCGLKILKYLCRDHKNSLKIGETRGVLAILVIFIEVKGAHSFQNSERKQLKTYKKSLQVLGLLAAATNTSGGILRNRIAAIVSCLKNLRDMIQHGDEHPELQRLSVDTLFHLAMEENVRINIGATGGVIRNLFKLVAKYDSVHESASPAGTTEPEKERRIREERKLASEKAGEALNRLVLQNKNNSIKLLGLKDETTGKWLVDLMVESLSKPDKVAKSAAQILRTVFNYADEFIQQQIAKGSVKVLLTHIFRRDGVANKSEMYEACLGLASRIFQPLDADSYLEAITNIDKAEFVSQLVTNLSHTPTTSKYPRIRRFSVELIIAVMTKDDTFQDAFRTVDLTKAFKRTLDSISEVENFCLFSGLVGYTRHQQEMEQLVQQALETVEKCNARSGKDHRQQ